MHLPAHFEETDLAVLYQLIRAHSLGTWVSATDGDLVVNHVPFLLDETRGRYGTLVGHVARANPVWRTAPGSESVVVFQGPQGYITPSWYQSKRDHGRVVPTWNYAVVHARGTPRSIEDPEWLRRQVGALSDRHEADRDKPWALADAPEDFIDGMLRAIVGIEIPLDSLVGKWKMSQNRPAADRDGVVAGLAEGPGEEERALARLVEARSRTRNA